MVPWDRLPEESAKAFAAFGQYRDLGIERSIDKAFRSQRGIQEGNKTAPGCWCAWSRNFRWVERAEAFDAEQDRRRREKWERERAKMDERHANLAMLMQQKVVDRLRTIDPANLSSRDIAQWLAEAVKIERLARGEATERVEQEHTGKDGGPIQVAGVPDLSKLTVEQLEKLDEILSAADEG